MLELVKQKGVYPHEYMDSLERLLQDKLPDRCKFLSSLEDECINEKYYLYGIDVWNVFKMKTMGDYHDLLQMFCCLFHFEKFINTCLNYYELDPSHYFNSPGLGWGVMLKMTGIELELINDIDMHLFIEKGMRGGISYIAKRHSEANNKYIKCYDSGKESKCIFYLDANNLYGWAMSQYLP